jgi:hypothetical protein
VTWDSVMHGAGVGCLIAITAISIAIFIEAFVPNWARIITTLRGNATPGFVPLSPTASVLSLGTRQPQLRAVEARAQPTASVQHR